MKKFEIGDGERVNYEIKRRESSEVTLRFKPDLKLELIVPKSWSGDPEEILEGKRPWIKERHRKLSRARRIINDDEILYKGISYGLRFRNNANERVILDEEDRTLTVNVRDDPMISLREWMKEKTKNYMLLKTKEYSELLDIKPNKVFVRDMKKWGSSSKKGNLSFNWQLIGLSEKLSEYVVLHEVLHLKYPKHTASFYSEMMSICPDYKERENELERYIPVPLPPQPTPRSFFKSLHNFIAQIPRRIATFFP